MLNKIGIHEHIASQRIHYVKLKGKETRINAYLPCSKIHFRVAYLIHFREETELL